MTAEQIYRQWHEAAKSRNTAALLALYHEAAELESPLVPIILNQNSGVLHGKAEIGRFLEEGTRRRPNEWVRWYRSGQYLASGDLLVWEYPRANRHFRADAAQRRPHLAPPHLLGLVRHTDADSIGSIQSYPLGHNGHPYICPPGAKSSGQPQSLPLFAVGNPAG